MLGLALGLGPRHRDVGALPLLLDGMPAVQGELRLDAVLGQHVAGNLFGLPGGILGSRIEEDLLIPRTNGDVTAKPQVNVLFYLALGKRSPRLLSLSLVGQRDRHAPVSTVCHGATLAHPERSRERARSGAQMWMGIGVTLCATYSQVVAM